MNGCQLLNQLFTLLEKFGDNNIKIILSNDSPLRRSVFGSFCQINNVEKLTSSIIESAAQLKSITVKESFFDYGYQKDPWRQHQKGGSKQRRPYIK